MLNLKLEIMKKLAKVFIAMGMICTLLFTTGCFGKFAVVKMVYKFHDSVAGDDMQGKVIKSLLLLLVGHAVYGLSAVADVLLFNVIEFWTGSNPLAMNAHQKETQIVEHNGIKFQITATQNKFEVKQLNGVTKGLSQSLSFNPTELAWYNTSNGASTKLIQYTVKNGEMVSATYFGTKGQTVVVNEAQLNSMFASVAAR
jgi:hypothetical protein